MMWWTKRVGLAALTLSAALAQATAQQPLADIRVRDPFILVDRQTQTYFLYAQMANRLGADPAKRGVEVYTSRDLRNWDGPEPVFEVPDDFWARDRVWAPEVHEYGGKYYLFVTFTGDRVLGQADGRPPMQPRGSQILVAESPRGPFRPFRNAPHTPGDWMALDGTLWVEDGTPWMIFCHEWVQIEDGTMELVRLEADLSDVDGAPETLFKASDAPWVRSLRDAGGRFHGYVTDGPFLYRTKTGELLMIWSSFGEQRYAIGTARSESRSVRGPWKQDPDPLFRADGGHGMIFTTLEGRLLLVFHQPNRGDEERARLYEIEDDGRSLRLR